MSVVALLTLYGAGLLTFASPCVLPLLPMYLAVLGGAHAGQNDRAAQRRLRLAGLGFALGLGLVFVVLGVGASALSATLMDHRRTFELGAGALMVFFGAKLLGIIRIPWLDRESRPLLERVPSSGGFWGGLLFGGAFAIGWTPCVGPVLGAALTYAASATADPAVAGTMLAVYAAGLATPLVAAAFAAPRLIALTRKMRRLAPILQRATGAVMVLVGLWLATDRLSILSPTAGAAECLSGSAACAPVGGVTPTRAEFPRGPALVEFVSGHCPACARMTTIVADLERRCSPGAIVRVNTDEPAGRALAEQYRVSQVPTFVSIDSNGREVERIVGEQSRERLAVSLRDIRGERCETSL